MKKFSEFSFWGCLHLITKCDAKVVNSSNISKRLYKKLYNINRKFAVGNYSAPIEVPLWA